jgi:hypothetical protein
MLMQIMTWAKLSRRCAIVPALTGGSGKPGDRNKRRGRKIMTMDGTSQNCVILGPQTMRAVVLSPDGKEYASSTFTNDDDGAGEAAEWASMTVLKVRYGIGLKELERLGWAGEWRLKIYE